LKVLCVGSEAAPFIKTGGLADVLGALPWALKETGVDVSLVIPKYKGIGEEFTEQMETVYEGTVALAWRESYLGVKKLNYNGVDVYFIDNEYYFGRDGLYGYFDDAERFGYFCRAVLAMLPNIGLKPDVIHTNDWHTGILGAYLKEDFMQDPFYAGIASIYTIHNLKYQGMFDRSVVEDVLGLPLRIYYNGNIENSGAVNFMKAGMCYADYVTTVSPTYAREIHYPYFGEGLEQYVSICTGKIEGILNGLNEAVYDPTTDKAIVANYNLKNFDEGKKLNKEALQKELGLPVNRDVPVLAMVTRLVEAKGMDLLLRVMDEIMQEEIQMVILGTGDRVYEDAVRDLERRYPDRVAVRIMFDEGLSRRIYASADFFLMPSRYEACGLSQMIAMRYGAVPIVRETGGLKDSVKPFDKYTAEGNGLTFVNFNAHEMLYAVKRGLSLYAQPVFFEQLVKNAMESDNSWERSARAYADLYYKVTGILADEADVAALDRDMEDLVADMKKNAAPEEAKVVADDSATRAILEGEEKSAEAAVKAEEPAEEKPAEEKTAEEKPAKKTVKRTATKKTTAKKAEGEEAAEEKPAKKTVKRTTKKTAAKAEDAAAEEKPAKKTVKRAAKKTEKTDK